MSKKVAVVGTGLVGRAWSIVFARGGFDVCLWDPVEGAAAAARENVERMLPELEGFDLLRQQSSEAVLSRIRVGTSLRDALDGACHMQESGPERVEIKRDIYRELVTVADADTVLASSTSGIPASAFTEDLPTRERCLVAHPINPPHIVPAVEMIPAPWTDDAVLNRTSELMRSVGQVPIRLSREIEGFLVNRLQGALLAEAFRLVEDGVCGVDDVDAAIADGLGLRWSFMGPFETIDLNSPTGVRGYCDMLGPLYYSLAKDQADPRPWGEAIVAKIEGQRRERLDETEIAKRQAWRDKRLAQLVRHKTAVAD
ncbi:MAG: 3-hydroxyacyl-CoA dehydrogenase [Gammaproteobacteria bacterium]|nr:3-hydroxyacyl-CoA dehydrogenase [Gammaproteobacteria bacterium]